MYYFFHIIFSQDNFIPLSNDLGGCNLIPEGSGANTKYYIQMGADAASKKLLGSNFVIAINCSVGANDVNGIFTWLNTYNLILTSDDGNISSSSNILTGTRQIYGNYFQPVFKINSISISYK